MNNNFITRFMNVLTQNFDQKIILIYLKISHKQMYRLLVVMII